jgi:Tol biopolymer transport system component/DNA-binding winged helix-turn-helix (wHTH) protein
MIATKRFVFRFSDIEVHEHELRATRAGQSLDLEPKAFRVLVYLIKHAGHLVTKRELIEAVWGETAVTDNSLTRVIALLRRVLEDDPRQPRYIETVTTVGYRWLCAVERVDDPIAMSAGGEAAEGGIDARGDLQDNASSPGARIAGRRPRTLWVWISAAISAPITLAVGFWYVSQGQPKVTNFTQITNDGVRKSSFVTDGSRIFYSARIGNEPRFYQISTQGGEPVHMSELDGFYPIDISASTSELLLRRDKDGTFWRASAIGSAPGPIEKINGSEAVWSPSGNQIAYITGKEIRIARSDGSNSRSVAQVAGGPFGLRWHPDGRKIAFSLFSSDRESIWEVSVDGTGLHRLFPQWTDFFQWYGSWTPDGRYFVFMALDHARSHPWDVWAVREKKRLFGLLPSKPVRLISGPLLLNLPVISPDGKRIFTVGKLDRAELVRYEPGAKQWTSYLPGLSAEQVEESPDSKSLVYRSIPEGAIFRSDPDGAHKLQLMPAPFQGVNPRWSPDGKQIAVAASRPGEPARVYLIPAEGGEARKLTNGECGRDEGESDPVWSSDGSSIVFGCSPVGSVSGLDRDHVVLRTVDLNTGLITVLPGSQGLWSPRWQPPGRFLVTLSFPQPEKLMLYDLQTHTQRELLAPKAGAAWNAVSRDGQYAFVQADGAEYRVRINDGSVERLTNPSAMNDIGWAGISLNGTLIATRDTGTWEFYALDWDAP